MKKYQFSENGKKRAFILFSREGCPSCEKLKETLSGLSEKIDYRVVTIPERNVRDALYSAWNKTGRHATMPQLFMVRRHPGMTYEEVIGKMNEIANKQSEMFVSYFNHADFKDAPNWERDLKIIGVSGEDAEEFLSIAVA